MKTSLNKTTLTKIRIIAAAILMAAGYASKSHAQTGYYAAGYQGMPAANMNPYHQQELARYHAEMAAYQQKLAVYQQQVAAYNAQRAAYDRAMAARPQQMPPVARAVAAPRAQNTVLRFDGRYASAPISAPAQVQHVVNAANSIQNKPYRRGGGHASVNDSAYDCSGSVSYALIKAGLLSSPLPSSGFATYGQPGPGRYITIYVKPGEHVFMTVCGLRMDTGGGRQEEGPRWRAKPRSADGFICRHPAGF